MRITSCRHVSINRHRELVAERGPDGRYGYIMAWALDDGRIYKTFCAADALPPMDRSLPAETSRAAVYDWMHLRALYDGLPRAVVDDFLSVENDCV